MDRYMKVVFTVIAIALVSLAVKDVNLFPIAEAQQGWEIDNELAMDGSMQALPGSNGVAYICRSTLVPNTSTYGDHGYLSVAFYTAPQCMGSSIGFGYMFSDGATHSYSHSAYLLSENQLLNYHDLVSRAADTGQRVRYFRCNGDKTNCLRNIQFRGDPADVDDAD